MLAVLGALFANALITILKFAAAVITGSGDCPSRRARTRQTAGEVSVNGGS